MDKTLKGIAIGACAASLVAVAGGALAQARYPDKPVKVIVGYAPAKLFKRVYGALMLSTSAGLAFISALAAVLISFGACLVAGLVLGGAFFAYVLSVLVGHVVLFVWLQRRETKA